MSYAAHVEVLFSPKYCDAFIIAINIYDGFRFNLSTTMSCRVIIKIRLKPSCSFSFLLYTNQPPRVNCKAGSLMKAQGDFPKKKALITPSMGITSRY